MEGTPSHLLRAMAIATCAAGARAQTTVRVSVNSNGIEADGICRYPAISGDGRHVAFMSTATNLHPGASGEQVYVHDRDPDGNRIFDEGNGLTSLISIGIDGLPGDGQGGGFNGHQGVAMSGNGRFVMWASQSTNLVVGDTRGFGAYDVFLRDRDPDLDGIFDEANASTERLNIGPLGEEANSPDNGNDRISLSFDGRYAAFSSAATNLTGTGDGNSGADCFRRDRDIPLTWFASLHANGTQGQDGIACRQATISGDGLHLAFVTSKPMVESDTNGRLDYYVRDLALGRTALVSVASDGTLGDQNSGDFAWGNDFGAAVSGEGRFVAFMSLASNLVPGDTNARQDVFLHDRDPDANGVLDEGFGATTRVSIGTGGAEGNGNSNMPAITADGALIAFWSMSSNLVAGDTNSANDIFVHDRIAGTTERVSLAENGNQGNGHSATPAISESGRYVAFTSSSNNLVGGDTNGTFDVFVRDRVGPPCVADFNHDGLLNVFDFLAFQTAFSNGDLGADIAPPFGVLNVFDFLAFQTAFSLGC